MSNTSDQTTKQNDKTRLIIGEVGIDTETGIVGKGHSYDNGKTFTVDDTIYGRIYHDDDHGKIWKGIQDQVAKVVDPAKSAADSAVSAADAAVASAQVTSDAVSAIASAQAEAMQGANEAMSRALSAWDVATGAKEAVTDFDPLLKSAQSDASQALAQIADTANALSDAKTAFGSDVAVAKELASTAQTTADNAVKSATSVASDLTAVANQAKSNANGITKVTSDVGLLQTTVADNSGNISKIQETATKIQQAVSDNSGNITTAKQTADSAVTVASDARSNATVAIQTASQASITASSASGQAASAVITANGALTTASNAKSDATVAVQTASGASLTATNAQSDATIAKQTASEATVQASNAESDFAQLSIRANKIEANVATNSGAIASVQQTANGLTTTVADIKANGGGVNLLQGTRDFSGDWLNLGTNFTKTGDTYNGLSIAETNVDWNGLAQYYPVKQGETYTFSLFARYTSGTGTSYFYIGLNTDPENGYKNAQESPGASTYSLDENWKKCSITFTVTADGYIKPRMERSNNNKNTLQVCGFMLEKGTVAHAWSPAPDDLQAQFTQIKQSINGVATTINDPKIGLNATYQTAAGNANTISSVKGDVTQLQSTANGLTSRVGNLESKTDKQQTTIDQNKAAIVLKADQTTVNTLKGNVDQNTATLKTQADNIQSKVSASDVTGMLTGYATQSYTQSLITQKADQWNLNITNLQTDVNAIKTTGGGVNLLTGTQKFQGDWITPQLLEGAETYKGLVVRKYSTAWVDSGQYYDADSNTTYTFSFYAKASEAGNFLEIFLLENADWNSPVVSPPVFDKQSITTEWQRYSVTFTTKSSGKIFPSVCLNKGGITVYTAGYMLEEGTIAHTWSPAPSDMATITSVTSLSASVDGIQSQVYNSDGSSRITQLSGLIQSKVGIDDFNNLKQAVNLQTLDSADINNMKTSGHYFVHNLANNPVGGWVYVDVTGDGSTRIRQDVYQDSGSQHKYRRWVDTNWTDWEEGATYSEINQLKDAINLRVKSGDLISQINLQAGTSLIQSNKLVLDTGTTVFTGNAFIPDAAISEINTDKLYFSDSNGNKSFMSTNLGALDPDAPANSLSIRYKTGYEVTTSDRGVFFMMGQDFTRYAVRSKYSDHFSGIFQTNTNAFFIEEGYGLQLWALGKDQSSWGVFNSNNVGIRASLTAPDSIEMGKVNDSYNYNDQMDTNPTAIQVRINGWAWVNGWVEAAGHSQHSTLSSKTRIEEADPDHMLDLVNNTELTTFAYKSELAGGTDHRHIGPIIDDINDVAQYQIPSEFIAPTKTARDDDNMIGALFGAVQALTKRIKKLEEKA